MKSRKRLGRYLLALLLLSTCVALMVKFFPRERDLLAESTKVADVRQWWTPVTRPNDEPYIWLSDYVLMVHIEDIQQTKLFIFDIRSGETIPLTKLHALIDRGQAFMPYGREISPDRQRVLWFYSYIGFGWNSTVFTAKLDGSHYQECPMPSSGSVGKVRWEEDSRHWIAQYHDQKKGGLPIIVRGDTNTPGKFLPIPSTPTEPSWVLFNQLVAEVVGAPPSDGGYVSNKWPRSRWIVLQPPLGTKVFDYATDEIGERVAWMCVVPRPSAFATSVKRWFPGYPAPTETVTELWVSRPDGTAMRHIGVLPYHKTQQGDMKVEAYGLDRPRFLRWLPDGKRISFVYEGMLCIVPVD